MAHRQTNEIVDRIRLQRHRLARSFAVPDLVSSVVEHTRQHPLAWIAGGIAVGVLSARLLVPGLVRVSRDAARHWLLGTIHGGVLHLAQGVFWAAWPRVPGQAHGEWEDATLDQEAPLQASGGPITALRSS